MIKRARNHATVTVLAALGVLAAPSLAAAARSPVTGGVSIAGSRSSTTPTPTPTSTGNPLLGNGNATVTASGEGITVSGAAATLLREQLRFAGWVPARDQGDTVEIERLGHETGWAWAPTTHATVGPGGSFTATWDTNHIGRFSIRAVVHSGSARAAGASPVMSIVVYRPSIATWYGPGFFGRQLACGGKLTRTTLGVANRTLPCGTKVALLYRGRTLTVPVVDRGPYANGADWDLTEATSQVLGMSGTATIGAASLPVEPGG